MKVERRVISVIVQNEHSVLARITGLFAARGYNIETLPVAPLPERGDPRLDLDARDRTFVPGACGADTVGGGCRCAHGSERIAWAVCARASAPPAVRSTLARVGG